MKNKIRLKVTHQYIQTKMRLLAFFLALFAAPLVCQAATDMADESFGAGGEVANRITNFMDRATAIVIQPDGKIITGGSSANIPGTNGYNFTLTRYTSDGSLDSSFGSGGKVISVLTNQNGSRFGSEIYGLALQADGKIVAAGKSWNGITLVRYNSDGSIDNSFGVNGIVLSAYVDLPFLYGISIALQTDGKIVVAGSGGTAEQRKFFTIRYTANGLLDSGFGANGRVLLADGFSYGASIVIQTNSKIVVGSGNYVFRQNADGTLDSTFGNNGIVSTVFEDGGIDVFSTALQPDGKIIIGGRTTNGAATNPIFYHSLARYNADGSLDASFGTNGKVVQPGPYSSSLTAIALQADGKILSTGASTRSKAETFRFNANGTIDRSFGTAGRFTSKASAVANALAIQSDGKIVVAGEVYTSGGTNGLDFMVARYISTPGRSIVKFDFDGDGYSDISVFRPATGAWYLNQSSAGMSGATFGAAGDVPVPADYDGDGKTDLAVYRGGFWYLLRSQAGFTAIQFGAIDGDIPMPADFDGDAKAELAIYRPSNGIWYQFDPTNNRYSADLVGQPGDIPVIVNFQYGDNYYKAQIGVYRNGIWRIMWKFLSGANQGFLEYTYGTAGDIPVPADYNGDGRTDLAVFRPSNATWYFQDNTTSAGLRQLPFGISTDLPVPADYDGDGKTDVAVYRDGTWYINRTMDGLMGINFGAATDIPAPKVYVP